MIVKYAIKGIAAATTEYNFQLIYKVHKCQEFLRRPAGELLRKIKHSHVFYVT